MKITRHMSPNFNDRRADTIDMIVLHYTDLPDFDTSLEALTDPAREVSAHYLIGENGEIFQLVEESKRAWHAGQSYWHGIRDNNSRSIGIEIQNRGHDGGLPPFSNDQMQSVAALCRDIIMRHSIPEVQVLAHSDIAPARKKDPGEAFDWKWLADQHVGFFPQTNTAAPDGHSLDDLLLAAGYDPDVTPQQRVRAFCRHYAPDSLSDPAKNTDNLRARAAALATAGPGLPDHE